MDLANFMILIRDLLYKDQEIVPKEAPLRLLHSQYDMRMYKNAKYATHSRHISRIMKFVRNGENCKMQNIDWCEGGLQLADIATKNVGQHDVTPRMRFIMIRLDD